MLISSLIFICIMIVVLHCTIKRPRYNLPALIAVEMGLGFPILWYILDFTAISLRGIAPLIIIPGILFLMFYFVAVIVFSIMGMARYAHDQEVSGMYFAIIGIVLALAFSSIWISNMQVGAHSARVQQETEASELRMQRLREMKEEHRYNAELIPFIALDGSFSVLLPDNKTEEISSIGVMYDNVAVVGVYLGELARHSAVYSVIYYQTTTGEKGLKWGPNTIEGLTTSVTGDIPAKMISKKLIPGKYPAVEFTAETQNCNFLKARDYKVHDRFYRVIAYMETKEDLSSEEVKRFFESFKILKTDVPAGFM